MFQIVAYNRYQKATKSKEIDLSASAALGEIVQFLPGVTASLIAFLTWGTTASFRKDIRQLFTRANPSGDGRSTSKRHASSRRRKMSALSVPSDFRRLQDEHDAMPSLRNIQVTTELSVLTELVETPPMKQHSDIDVVGPWTMQEDLDYVRVKPPVRSKSKLGTR